MKRALVLSAFFAVSARMALAADNTIVVSDVWSRPATGTAVVYATIRNTGGVPEQLVGASSPLATRVELHKSTASTMSGMSSSMNGMQMSGSMMSMSPVSAIPIPAHGSTALAPGGYHLMLFLRRDLQAGESVPLRLHFAKAGWVETTSHVRPIR